jgi:hypothetical protein
MKGAIEMKMRQTANFDGWFVATTVTAALIGIFLIVVGIAAMLITLPKRTANVGTGRAGSFRDMAAMESCKPPLHKLSCHVFDAGTSDER